MGGLSNIIYFRRLFIHRDNVHTKFKEIWNYLHLVDYERKMSMDSVTITET